MASSHRYNPKIRVSPSETLSQILHIKKLCNSNIINSRPTTVACLSHCHATWWPWLSVRSENDVLVRLTASFTYRDRQTERERERERRLEDRRSVIVLATIATLWCLPQTCHPDVETMQSTTADFARLVPQCLIQRRRLSVCLSVCYKAIL